MTSHVQGYVALLLHAHIPYVRHTATEITLEERWFFEAVVDTYLPLIDMMERLLEDGVSFRLTLSLSPPLLAMLEDSRLHVRLRKHLSSLCELGQREVIRLWGDEAFGPLAKLYTDHYHRLSLLYDRLHGDLIAKFRSLSSTGCLELMTCAATHAFLPLIKNDETIRAQLEAAVQEFRRHFGVAPAGIWLPECGYSPALEPHLQALDLRYFVVDTHAHSLARRDDDADIAGLPLRTASGACAFARDPESSAQVWSAEAGYPGDPDYREYHRDIGYDLGRAGGAEWEYLKPYVLPNGARIPTGFKYYSVTGDGDAKVPYHPARAAQKAQQHAEHFIASRVAQVRRLAERRKAAGASASAPTEPSVIVCPYDAELFGHWWYEGHQWLEAVLRGLAARSDESVVVQTTTLGGYAAAHAPTTVAELLVSSWGRGGYAEVWLQPRSQWVTPRLHAAEDRMVLAAGQHRDPALLSSAQLRVLNQAARELLLAQSSDWTFILDADTVTSYATKRIETHLSHFHNLLNTLDKGTSDKELSTLVHSLERKTPFLPDLHYQLFQNSSSRGTIERSFVNMHADAPMKEVAVTTLAGAATLPRNGLRILMLAWEYPPHVIGGLARAVYDLSRQLASDGHTVHVLTCQAPDCLPYEFSEGVHIHRAEAIPTADSLHFLDQVFQMNMAFSDNLMELCRQGLVFDIVHAHDWLVYYAAQVAKQELRLPLLATIHATEMGRNQGKLESPLQKRIHTLEGKLTEIADHLIVCSLSMQQEVMKLFHLPAHQITRIPNGVIPLRKPDLEAPTLNLNPLLADALADTGSDSPGRILAFLGRLVFEKGVHTLLAAMPLVWTQYPTTKLVIAGTGPEREALEAASSSFGDRIIFTGFLDEADKSYLLDKSELCVFPSLYEPFGIVALEAMASGTPIIVSDVGGLAEIVQHGHNGCKVQPGHAEDLAQQIIQLLEQPKYASKLASAALRTVTNDFNWSHIGSLTTHVYETVISTLASPTSIPPQQKEIIK